MLSRDLCTSSVFPLHLAGKLMARDIDGSSTRERLRRRRCSKKETSGRQLDVTLDGKTGDSVGGNEKTSDIFTSRQIEFKGTSYSQDQDSLSSSSFPSISLRPRKQSPKLFSQPIWGRSRKGKTRVSGLLRFRKRVGVHGKGAERRERSDPRPL